MKTRSVLFSMLFAASAFTLFSNCAGEKKEEATETHDNHDAHSHNEKDHAADPSTTATDGPQFQVDDAFQKQLAGVFNTYVSLKEAFVSSDAGKVKEEASKTQESLGKVDMKLLSGAAHNDWMNYLAGMESSLQEIRTTEDIEAQRQAFSTLSGNLFKSIKAYGLGGDTAYYAFCPMAFNDQGGFWLSDAEEIRNPYFGDKMLTCGVVREKLN